VKGVSYVAICLLTACTPTGADLLVDLRTDLTPGVEFFTVETRLDGERTEMMGVLLDQDVLDGLRIAEYDEVASEIHTVDVELLDPTRRPTRLTEVLTRVVLPVTRPSAPRFRATSPVWSGRPSVSSTSIP
jgi:hypothetical protein